MTELVPFQDKRKKQFPEAYTCYQAVNEELQKYFADQYPTIEFGKPELVTNEAAITLEKQSILELPTFESFSKQIALITSPELLNDKTIKCSLSRLEAPVLLLCFVAKSITKKPYLVLPKPYQKMVKRVYTSATTLKNIAEFLNSKKRAKKYLRILQKRLGIFSSRKPPFTKVNATAPRSAIPQKK